MFDKDKATKQVLIKGFLSKGLYQLDVSQLKKLPAIANDQDHVVDIDVVQDPIVVDNNAASTLIPFSHFSCNKIDYTSCNKVDFVVS